MLLYPLAKAGAFKTGRTYDKPQEIHWRISSIEPVEMNACIICVHFQDDSRRINGCCEVYVDINASIEIIEHEILKTYDAGDYIAE